MIKMRAGGSQLKPAVFVFILNVCFYSSFQFSDLQVCRLCEGTVLHGSEVNLFCSSAAGWIEGRCCVRNDTASDLERAIVGLDLSNCSLTHVEDLQGASTAVVVDLSLNPIANISDTTFQGFVDLNFTILPADLPCPGGNASWQSVELKGGNRLCKGQKDLCNQTGHTSIDCPANSLCAPYGPGFFECSCAGNHHGYKCLREGEFPALQVFGPLGASTVVISFMLWFTQRRHVKSP